MLTLICRNLFILQWYRYSYMDIQACLGIDIHVLIHTCRQIHIHIPNCMCIKNCVHDYTQRWTNAVLSVPQVSKLVPIFSDSSMCSQVVLKPTNLPQLSHFGTMKQINTPWFSSGINLLSFAKLEIFDIVCQRGKKIKGK